MKSRMIGTALLLLDESYWNTTWDPFTNSSSTAAR